MNIVNTDRSRIYSELRFFLTEHGLDFDNLPATAPCAGAEMGADGVTKVGETVALTGDALIDAQTKTIEMVTPWMYKPLRFYFDKQCPNWHVTDAELDHLCTVYGRLFAKYFPDFYQHPIAEKVAEFVENFAVEAEVIVSTWRFVRARKGVPRKLDDKDGGNGAPKEQPRQESPAKSPKSSTKAAGDGSIVAEEVIYTAPPKTHEESKGGD